MERADQYLCLGYGARIERMQLLETSVAKGIRLRRTIKGDTTGVKLLLADAIVRRVFE